MQVPEAPAVTEVRPALQRAPERAPVDVAPHRRGRVSGQELIAAFEAYCLKYDIVDTPTLTGEHVELYNMLNSM